MSSVIPRSGITDSPVGTGGRSVAPGAGAAVVTVAAASLPAGVYDVTVAASIGVGGLAADAGNMELRKGSTVVAVLAVPSVGSEPFGPFRITLDGSTALSVNATAAATAGIPYTATLSIRRIA